MKNRSPLSVGRVVPTLGYGCGSPAWLARRLRSRHTHGRKCGTLVAARALSSPSAPTCCLASSRRLALYRVVPSICKAWNVSWLVPWLAKYLDEPW